jgi:hypothetical protein
MATVATTLTPQERLASTRQALIRQMNGKHPPGSDELDAAPAEVGGAAADPGAWPLGIHLARSWWANHPAHAAMEVAQPMVQEFAKRQARTHPWRMLAISAGAGAALVLIKPWRLVSAAGAIGVALSGLKAANTPQLLASFLASKPGRRPPYKAKRT